MNIFLFKKISRKKSFLLLKTLFLFTLIVNSNLTFSQTVIGTYPSLDGGFEGQATGNLVAGSGGNTALTTSTWTVNTTATIFRAVTATGGRSGPKYLTFGPNSVNNARILYSPQLSSAFAVSTQYTIQFYYRQTATVTGSLTTNTVDLYVDNNSTTSAGTRQNVTTGLTSSVSSWTKVSVSLTTSATPAASTNGVAGLTIQGSGGFIYSADLDDYVVYQGAVDNTAPNTPGSVSVTGNVGSIGVSWGAASGGVDGGGYVVVRYPITSPAANDDPNQNGIYAVGNSTTGTVTGTVRYIGTGTSFTDNVGLTTSTDYYYKVYTVDKAFNYSAESQSAAVQSVLPYFYYDGSGSLANVTNWGTNTNGSGTNPTNFTTDGQTFEIRNTTAVGTDAVWTVSGTGSKIVLGSTSAAGITFTVNTGFNVTNITPANFDISLPSSGNHKIVYKDALAISLATISDPNLVIEVDGATFSTATSKTYQTINIINGALATFTGNFITTNFNISTSSTATISAATPTITNLVVDNLSTIILTNPSTTYVTIPTLGSVTINGILQTAKAAGFVSSNVVTAASTFGSIQFIGTENLTLGSSSTIMYNRSTTTNNPQTVTPRTDYKNLNINTTGAASTVTLTGNLSVANTLTLNSAMAINGNTLTINGAISGSGTISGSATSNLTIGNAAGTVSFTLGARTLNNLIIGTGSNASMSLGSALDIAPTGGITFNAAGTKSFTTTGQTLTLKSDATGTAYIGNTNNTTISGNVTVERFISSAGRRWRFLSSPVQSATVANWMTQFYVTGPGTAATLGLANSNGWHTSQANIDFPSSITTTSIRTFSEANSTLINLNAGWANLTGTNQSLTAGQGFRAFIRGPLSGGNVQLGPLANAQSQAAFTLSLTGAINSGDITPPSLTNSQTGWNLLGNPYPCAYNFNAHYDAAIGSEIANIDPVVYAYNSTAGTPGYVSFNASSNTAAGLTGGIIPSGAGFFIQATGIPTFIFKETYKTTTASASVHKTDISYVEFGIKYSKDTLQGDYMVIKMFDGATLNSELYDIKKLQNEDLNLSAFGVDNVDLTASCIPFISEETRIKLNIEAVEVGTYKFDFTNMDNFDKGVSVSLLDKYNNKTTDVKANTKYTFEMGGDVNQWGKNRFELILNGKATTGVNNTIAKKAAITNLTVYPNPATDVLNISLSNGTVIEIVNIYTVSGKLVNNIKLNGNQIDISQLNNGVYMVEVLTADGSFKTKFVK